MVLVLFFNFPLICLKNICLQIKQIWRTEVSYYFKIMYINEEVAQKAKMFLQLTQSTYALQ